MVRELPAEVLTFGGNAGKKYHRLVRVGGDPRPACGSHGDNPLEKERKLIEVFYEPCRNCFPRVAREEGSA